MPGPAIATVDLALAPAVWQALGFTVREDGVSRVGATALRLTGAATG
ncbi:MAG: hypothetical protein JWM31_1323, partial [Solirubrobacterales bacterium]|nr:hypothetical protein [Solirubrobacterales bacterium]